jgi:hypothetical protein
MPSAMCSGARTRANECSADNTYLVKERLIKEILIEKTLRSDERVVSCLVTAHHLLLVKLDVKVLPPRWSRTCLLVHCVRNLITKSEHVSSEGREAISRLLTHKKRCDKFVPFLATKSVDTPLQSFATRSPQLTTSEPSPCCHRAP